MISTVTVTTSWDDGHILDLKLAGLLQRYSLPGTFYISPDNREIAPGDLLGPEHIREISRQFEIGAHTLTHPRLPAISEAQARAEIAGSKIALEEIIGRPVDTFCYPGGEFAPLHAHMVAVAGYRYGRTVERFASAVGDKPLIAPTSLHAYRHWSDLLKIARFARFNPFKTFKYLLNWDELAIAMFDRTLKTGGVYHLWGHSWEIEAAGDWERLERVFAHISQRHNVRYIPNGELV